METYFASPERNSEQLIQMEIEFVQHSSIIRALLTSISGVLALVNEHRQILAVNTEFFRFLNIQNPDEVLGLRPGEVLQCVHAHKMPAGCGTSKYCTTCGAAVAIVACLDTGRPQERRCAATVMRQDKQDELLFSIQVMPFEIEGHHYMLLFLQDIIIPQRWAALEHTFFHDITNLINGLWGSVQLLQANKSSNNPKLTMQIEQLASRLADEVAIQQALLGNHDFTIQSIFERITVEQIFQEVVNFYHQHPVSKNKRLTVLLSPQSLCVQTHVSLLLRVLCNMVTNAFESTPEGGEVRVWTERSDGSITFCVWNACPIPPEIQLRIFQKNFTTKDALGHGLGTYAMKLIGEQLLQGVVSFSSSDERGTCFRYTYPIVN